MLQKTRKTSMRQIKDEADPTTAKQSPTYLRAAEAAGKTAAAKPPQFFRGARVRGT